MINITQKGDMSNITAFLEKHSKKRNKRAIIEGYARRMVLALQEATPKETGKTAASWRFNIVEKNGEIGIELLNDNIQNGVSIAMILQYGHATKSGYWIEGRDYINPAIQPLFDEMAKNLLGEVK